LRQSRPPARRDPQCPPHLAAGDRL